MNLLMYLNAPIEGQGGQNLLGTFLPMILIVAVFYFLIIRPQKKKEKETKNMINAIGVGDELVTIGGVFGKVLRIKDDTFIIETTADKTRLHIAKWAVKEVTKKSEAASEVSE